MVTSIKASKQPQLNPYMVYLNTLSPTGRRSLASLLNTALGVLNIKKPPERFDWCSLGYEELVLIRAKLMDKGRSIHTVNATLAALRGVVRTSFHMGLIDGDTMLRVTAVKCVKGETLPKGRSLSSEQLSGMINRARCEKGARGKRDSAILQVLAYTGIRREELVQLSAGDYDRNTGELRIRAGKGRRQRFVPVPRRVQTTLEKWLKHLDDTSSPLFCQFHRGGKLTRLPLSGQTIYALVQDYARQAGIDHCTPHDLRRTFITQLLAKGVDINTVRRYVGHSNIMTTTLYDYRMA